MTDAIKKDMRIASLESELSDARRLVSRAICTLLQVRVAIEEDDVDEALRIIEEATE